jgi:chromosome segregation ATPase
MTLRVSFEDLFSVVGEYYNAGDGLDYHDPTVIQDVVQAITGTVDDMKKDIENGLNADGFIYDDAPVKADITTNKNDIATNKQDIATNKGAINNSAATMQQQQRTVQANTQQTTANRNNIDTEGLRIDANEQRIATNKQEIAKNKQRSLQNFYATDKNKRDIATNKEAIANAGGGGAASSHSTLHIRKMGADDSFTIDGQNLNH